MNSVSSAPSALSMDWFQIKGRYAVPKTACQDEINKALAAQKQKDIARRDAFFENIKKGGADATLSAEQKQYLSETYNPTDMAQEDYQALLDDLCKFGVLTEEDKGYLSYGGLQKLDLSEPSCVITPMVPGRPMDTLSDCKGNALEWTRFQASFESFDPASRTFGKSMSAVLFGKVRDVLEQIR